MSPVALGVTWVRPELGAFVRVTVFLVVGFAGLALLAVSLVVGDLFDGAFNGAFEALAGDWVSSAALGGFVSALGFGAALAAGAGAPSVVTGAVGVAAGFAFGWFATWLTRLVKGGGSDATPAADDTVGRDATVLTSIPADGFGTVKVLLGGHSLRYNARSEEPIEAGTAVHVTGVLSPTAVTVAPVWRELS
jgi:membrane-bound ClpP family serine protease